MPSDKCGASSLSVSSFTEWNGKMFGLMPIERELKVRGGHIGAVVEEPAGAVVDCAGGSQVEDVQLGLHHCCLAIAGQQFLGRWPGRQQVVLPATSSVYCQQPAACTASNQQRVLPATSSVYCQQPAACTASNQQRVLSATSRFFCQQPAGFSASNQQAAACFGMSCISKI
jgi:hypothetical protein